MSRRRYALVGTGSRAEMWIRAVVDTYSEHNELVSLCDVSQTRMNWYNQHLDLSVPTFKAEQFDEMIESTKPHTVIVTTPDYVHHQYITRAMELGCDVITEKPLTIDGEKLCAIWETIERTGRSLKVAFNYRYSPTFTQLRQLIAEGVIGKPLAVDFAWLLDTSHGADYFRRWHREKQYSGGLLVHKATHHFDLVNWWIDSYPDTVFALGKLAFYGSANAAQRGEQYPYERYTGEPAAKNDPFALTLDQKAAFKGLYLDAEAETGYIRDRNVFSDPITIEDTMCVTVRYQNGALLSYNLIAYAPWEGLRVAITGTKGRVELDVQETVSHLSADSSTGASKGTYTSAEIRVHPLFSSAYTVPVNMGDGGHGGADPVMLQQIFSPFSPTDPFGRAASHIDGAASILVGIAANQSMQTERLVHVADIFTLPEKRA